MRGKSGTQKGDGRGGGNSIPVERGAGAVDGFESFVMCCVPVLGSLAVASLEKDADMLADAGVIEVESPRAANVIGDAVEEMEFEGG